MLVCVFIIDCACCLSIRSVRFLRTSFAVSLTWGFCIVTYSAVDSLYVGRCNGFPKYMRTLFSFTTEVTILMFYVILQGFSYYVIPGGEDPIFL